MIDFNEMTEKFKSYPVEMKKGILCFSLGWVSHFISLYIIFFGIWAPPETKGDFTGLTQNEALLWIGMFFVLFYGILNSKSWAKNLSLLFCLMAIIYYGFFAYFYLTAAKGLLFFICSFNILLFSGAGYFFTKKNTVDHFKKRLEKDRMELNLQAEKKMKDFEKK